MFHILSANFKHFFFQYSIAKKEKIQFVGLELSWKFSIFDIFFTRDFDLKINFKLWKKALFDLYLLFTMLKQIIY